MRLYLDNEDPEMQRAWQELGDPVMENQGESWRYMGSWDERGPWVHCFRHRCHPATDSEMRTNIPASPEWIQSLETN